MKEGWEQPPIGVNGQKRKGHTGGNGRCDEMGGRPRKILLRGKEEAATNQQLLALPTGETHSFTFNSHCVRKEGMKKDGWMVGGGIWPMLGLDWATEPRRA